MDIAGKSMHTFAIYALLLYEKGKLNLNILIHKDKPPYFLCPGGFYFCHCVDSTLKFEKED